MAMITFDTLEFTDKLKNAGFTQDQAEAVIRVLRDAQGDLLTKDYFEQHLDAKLSEAKFDIIKWGAGMLLAQAGLVAALVKLI